MATAALTAAVATAAADAKPELPRRERKELEDDAAAVGGVEEVTLGVESIVDGVLGIAGVTLDVAPDTLEFSKVEANRIVCDVVVVVVLPLVLGTKAVESVVHVVATQSKSKPVE
jgi:hypothetical protein